MIKLKGLTLVLGSCFLVAVAVGCGKDRSNDYGGNGNSETHFLATCTDSCPGDLTCLCGVCTKPCASSSECSVLAASAECANACNAPADSKMCDVPCDADLDCGELGAGYLCQVGHCRLETPAGSGGALGSGGKSGAGGSGGSGGSAPTVVTDVASFELALFEAECQQIFDCGDGSEDSVFFRGMVGTPERCVTMLAGSPLYRPAEGDLDQKVGDGSIELSLDQVPACLAAIRTCVPDGFARPDTPQCRAVFRGSASLDGPCSRSEDCADDARCLIDAECPGHCARRAALGEACDSTADCDDRGGPVVCNASACARLTIATPSDVNGPCSPFNHDDLTFTPCARGLSCAAIDSTLNTGSCRAPVALDGDCADGDFCSNDQACVYGVCRTLVFAEKVGDACDTQTQWCDVSARLTCIDGSCQVVGDGTEGALCRPLDEAALVSCDAGLVCLDPDPATEMTGPGGYFWGACGKPRSTGEVCVENDDCASQHCGTDGTCGGAYCCGAYSCQSN